MKRDSLRSWVLTAALATLLHGVGAGATVAMPPATDTPAALLAQAEQIKLSDPSRFARILQRLHRHADALTPAQRWQLRLLDATQNIIKGDYAQAKPVLQDIVDHSGDPNLSSSATAQLIQGESLNHHYGKAYEMANTLLANLPNVTDRKVRLAILSHVIQMMNNVGQYDLALKYARQIKHSFPSKKGQCEGNLYETQTLTYANRITSDSPAFEKTIRLCLAANMEVFANAAGLDLARKLTEDGHADKAITLLKRIAPGIHKADYQYHIYALPVTLAEAYNRLGDDINARKFALAALAQNASESGDWVTQYATQVLYQVEKRAGHDGAALAYYEKYVAQQKINTDEAKTRALAYQMVKQNVLAKKMRVDALSRQNKILELRQALAHKSAETSRLHLVLLLVVLASIILILWRVKHTQLRFRRMARHDGLTDTLTRQYFLDQAQKTLHRLEKSHTDACLVLMDLDHFKRVNDTFGHAAGDEVLARIVASARGQLRASDVFGRLGGEEFGILMPACDREQGVEITHRIRNAIADAPVALSSGPVVHMSASFGLACASVTGYVMRDLLTVADTALYRAKDGGRNRLVVGVSADRHAKSVGAPDAP